MAGSADPTTAEWLAGFDVNGKPLLQFAATSATDSG